MMGQHSRSESLFYYFRIEDQVPENHLLRLLAHKAAGPRIEPPVSVPMPPRISSAATPAPVPLLLPAVK